MRIGKLIIAKHKPLPQIVRKLPLEHFYTFSDGVKIYTYRDSDLPLISNRYLDNVKDNLMFLQEYAMTKNVYEAWVKAAKETIEAGLNDEVSKGEALATMHRLFSEQQNLFQTNKELNTKMWHDLFCMFFVLDGEDEMQFSEAENARKLEYLNGLTDKEQSFFFNYLNQKINYFRTTYKEDLASYIMGMQKEKASLESFNELLSRTGLNFMQPNTQESESTS